MDDEEIIIGIDLGTTNSCVSIWRNKQVEVIQNSSGKFTTPSMVGFSKNEIVVGEVAKSKISKNYENTIYGVKRLIGRNFDSKEVQEDIKYFPFKTEKDEVTGKPKFKVTYNNKTEYYFPEDISGFVLKEMKNIAETYLNKKVTDAVITVPAYFTDPQRKATQAAAKKAGLDVRRIINEPTAAALAYGLHEKIEKNQNVLIFDLGGGTFDVSILNMRQSFYDVKSSRGDMHLGGDNFDNELVQYCLNELKEKGKDYSKNEKIMLLLKEQCERAKINLSNSYETNINIESIEFSKTVLRAEFENICEKHFNKLIPIVELALKDANLTKEKINEIVLVGGSTRMPKIQEIVKDYFNKEPYQYKNKSIDVDKVVSMGAAIQGAVIEGVEEGGIEKILFMDITPFTLGIELRNGEMDPLIKRNTKIPFEASAKYKVVGESVKIKIYQGEKEYAKQNTYLGFIEISPNVDVVEVIFFISIDGVLSTTSKEKGGIEKEITINLSHYLNQ